MSLQNRETLKNYFRKGTLPSEKSFNDLIDSLINRVDDGMSKTMDDGLMLAPMGDSEKLLSFYKSIEEKSPAWSFGIDRGDAKLNIKNRMGEQTMTLTQAGRVGVNNEDPKSELDVNGVITQRGRSGSAHTGWVPGNGEWHTIIDGLNGCHALEIVAGIGKKKTGKYALMVANALSTYGKSNSSIKIMHAYYGSRANRILLRWRGDTYNHRLELKTRANYGDGFGVQFHVSALWHDTLMDGSFQPKE
ncbi:hypothetical protein N7E81_10190 [Reichenbachiella carrageenanivorans]|uniref:Adhesin n=1 Tax=Reichenbachiella carrageenanivorans TaxID=2979869 RepID=A0ABY6CV42_9BACT|nr:hypothetical protein [Reichenbachiella carrageenanivorans]UXX77738.1 hypothetical protein N7E81_10190 [Reichenbachiella carrageenanivorans]